LNIVYLPALREDVSFIRPKNSNERFHSDHWHTARPGLSSIGEEDVLDIMLLVHIIH
jgi:hypothetical protein